MNQSVRCKLYYVNLNIFCKNCESCEYYCHHLSHTISLFDSPEISIYHSGVADVEVCPCPYQSPQNETHTEAHLKRSALSNSLLDMHEQCKCHEHSTIVMV